MGILYLDCFSGISGDMFVGAMLDLGISLDSLKSELAKLNLDGFEIETSRVNRSGISATKFDVVQTHSSHTHTHSHSHSHTHPHSHEHTDSHSHRSLSEIERMIRDSQLKDSVKSRALAIFKKLGEAEARVHNVELESIHFHEVGAVDSIVDIVGSSICLDLMGIGRVEASPLKLGYGTFKCAHGVYPVPGPATAEILKRIPTLAGDVEGELVTPTGAAIVATIASSFGPQPPLQVQAIGYGAGTRNTTGHPNVLRVMAGTGAANDLKDEVLVIETNIDDMNPQLYGHVMEQLFGAGALDVFITPVQMKKNRPGHLLTIIAQPADRERMISTLFAETTTLGCRWRVDRRQTLKREHALVSTRFGMIRIKLGYGPDGNVSVSTPEFDDCREAALRSGVSLKEVQSEAMSAYLEQRKVESSLIR